MKSAPAKLDYNNARLKLSDHLLAGLAAFACQVSVASACLFPSRARISVMPRFCSASSLFKRVNSARAQPYRFRNPAAVSSSPSFRPNHFTACGSVKSGESINKSCATPGNVHASRVCHPSRRDLFWTPEGKADLPLPEAEWPNHFVLPRHSMPADGRCVRHLMKQCVHSSLIGLPSLNFNDLLFFVAAASLAPQRHSVTNANGVARCLPPKYCELNCSKSLRRSLPFIIPLPSDNTERC
jgi:hypothetical protein